MSHEGKKFSDASLLSGADHIGDGRSVVLFDYNRDGLTDIASINTNAPKLALFRNEVPSQNSFAAFRLIGANQADRKSEEKSNRDAYGARITIKVGDLSITEELRAGEGFSAQNSRTLLIGLGKAELIKSATVTWPSGRIQTFRNLPVRQLTIFREGDEAALSTPYSR